MYVFGADFSGAKNPSKGIYYAMGELEGSTLRLKVVRHCEDRLDLYGAIITSNAPWGIDFPFAIPEEAYSQLDLANWDELLELAIKSTRNDFMETLESCLEQTEARCAEGRPGCRVTDIVARSFSPFKQYNPNMRDDLWRPEITRLSSTGRRCYLPI